MNLSVRELEIHEIGRMVDYFITAKDSFLKGMGADKSKLPTRDDWIQKLELDFNVFPLLKMVSRSYSSAGIYWCSTT